MDRMVGYTVAQVQLGPLETAKRGRRVRVQDPRRLRRQKSVEEDDLDEKCGDPRRLRRAVVMAG